MRWIIAEKAKKEYQELKEYYLTEMIHGWINEVISNNTFNVEETWVELIDSGLEIPSSFNLTLSYFKKASIWKKVHILLRMLVLRYSYRCKAISTSFSSSATNGFINVYCIIHIKSIEDEVEVKFIDWYGD